MLYNTLLWVNACLKAVKAVSRQKVSWLENQLGSKWSDQGFIIQKIEVVPLLGYK